MNNLFLDLKQYKVPASYNELTGKQLVDVARVLYGGVTQRIATLMLVMSFVNARSNFYLKWLFYKKITNKDLSRMHVITDFIFKEITLTKNVMPCISVPVFKIFSKKLYGPSDRLSNIVFIEFIKAEMYFLKYVKNNDQDSLDHLVAILYRERKSTTQIKSDDFDGDVRVKYNDHRLVNNVELVKKLSPEVKQAVYLLYYGCREYIIKRYPKVFTKPKTDRVQKSNGSYTWSNVLLSLAGSKFGTAEQTAFTPLSTILMELTQIITDREKQEAEIEALKNKHKK